MVMAPEGAVADAPLQPHEISLAELQKQRIPITVEGRSRPLLAWVVRNNRYPASIAGELEDARLEYQAARERVWEGPPPPDFVETVRDLVREWENTPAEGVFDLRTHMELIRKALRTYDEVPRYKPSNRLWETYVTRCLIALIPGLEEHEAELIPAPKRVGWLFDLGYFTARQADQPPEAADTSPPEEPAPSIGAERGPDSDGTTE